MENREQENIFLNSALMSNMSTSLRVTITLIRVSSSVPAPYNQEHTYGDVGNVCARTQHFANT